MVNFHMRTILLGRDGERTQQHLRMGTVAFVVILVTEVVLVTAAKSVWERWPVQEVLFGIQGTYLLFVGLLVVGNISLLAATASAHVNNGMFVSIFMGILPVAAYYIGWVLVGGGSNNIGFYLLIGAILGCFGYGVGIVSRGLKQTSSDR